MMKLSAMVITISMLMATTGVMAQKSANQKAVEKEIHKEAKAKMKEYKAGGWKVFDSSRTLDALAMNHIATLIEKGNTMKEVVGYATAKSKNLASAAAFSSALQEYAREEGASFKGKFLNELKNDIADPGAEYDKFAAIYLGNVEKAIQGEMKHSYSVIRTKSDGLSEVQAYYLVDLKKAAAAREEAIKNTISDSEFAKKFGDKLVQMVKESNK